MTAPPWTKAPVGTSVGTCHFYLSSAHYYFLDLGNEGRSYGRPRRATISASSTTWACLPSSEHHPPTHLVATIPRHTRLSCRSHSSGTGQLSFGHEDAGAGMQQLSSAATGDPDGLHRSDMRSAVLISYPPSHGIRAHPHLRHLWLCLAPRRCYSEGFPSTCGTGGM